MSASVRRVVHAFALLLLALPIDGARAQSVIGTVGAGTDPRAIAVDPNTGRVFVANESSNDVTVIDPGTRATTRVPVGKRPQYIAVNARTNRVYVANSQDNSLSVIDGATLAVTTYNVNGAGPLLIDEAINRIYMVRLGNADEVTYFNGNDNTFHAIATDSYSPVAMALNPYTARLYVANAASGDLRVVDTTSASDFPPTLSIGIWSNPRDVAVDPAANRIFAVGQDPRGPISVIHGDSNAPTFLAPAGHAAGGTSVVTNPFTGRAYFGFNGEIGVLDVATSALTFIPVAGAVTAMKANVTSNRLYALTANALVVVDGATHETATVPMPPGARDLAVDPVANLVYVAGPGGVTIVQGTGAAGATPPLPPPAPTTYGFNVQGMWWASPGGSESGWGLDLSHQGNKVFATWFTYDLDGQPMWLAMSDGWRSGDNAYAGDLYRMSGPPMTGAFDPTRVKAEKVGYLSLSFVNPNEGNFTAQVKGTYISRKIGRFQFTPQGSSCATGGAAGALPNYQDLWWHSPAGSESGWGIFLTHQADTLFLAWFTYAADGRGTWLVASNVAKTGNAQYSGTLFRAAGPPYDASPWDGSRVTMVAAGSVTLDFSDEDHAALAYVVDAQAGTKPLTRFAFSSPKTLCR